MNDIKSLYNLRTEFKSKTEACSYLYNQGFEQDPYVPNAWYNDITGVDAHISLTREANGDVTFIVTPFSKEVEKNRSLVKVNRPVQPKNVIMLERKQINYSE